MTPASTYRVAAELVAARMAGKPSVEVVADLSEVISVLVASIVFLLDELAARGSGEPSDVIEHVLGQAREFEELDALDR